MGLILCPLSDGPVSHMFGRASPATGRFRARTREILVPWAADAPFETNSPPATRRRVERLRTPYLDRNAPREPLKGARYAPSADERRGAKRSRDDRSRARRASSFHFREYLAFTFPLRKTCPQTEKKIRHLIFLRVLASNNSKCDQAPGSHCLGPPTVTQSPLGLSSLSVFRSACDPQSAPSSTGSS